MNLLQNDVNFSRCEFFYHTGIMSLHYLMKLEMLIAHYLTSTVASKFARFESSW